MSTGMNGAGICAEHESNKADMACICTATRAAVRAGIRTPTDRGITAYAGAYTGASQGTDTGMETCAGLDMETGTGACIYTLPAGQNTGTEHRTECRKE